MTTALTPGGLPHGWHASRRLVVARTFDDGSTLHISRTGYVIEAADGTVLAHGDDHRPAPQATTWPEVIASLVAFLEHDAETYRTYFGPVPDHHDGYLFGEPGAAWAYQHEDALATGRLDAEEPTRSIAATRHEPHDPGNRPSPGARDDSALADTACEVCQAAGPVALQQVGDDPGGTFRLCATCGAPAVDAGLAQWLDAAGA